MWRWGARAGVAVLLTGTFAYWAVAIVDMAQVTLLLAGVSTDFAFPMAAFALLTVGFRCLRLVTLLGPSHSLILLRASALHGLAVALLPAKLGEFVLPAALVQGLGMGVSRAAGLLILIRAYDLLFLVGAGAGAFGLSAKSYGMENLSSLCLIGAAIATVLFATLPLAAQRFRAVILRQFRHKSRLATVVDGLTAAAAELTIGAGLKVAIVTSLIWGSFFALCHTAALAAHGAWQAGASVIAATGGALAFALPVNGIANLGPFEAAFAGTLVAGGAELEAAMVAALLVHLWAVAAAAVGVLLVLLATFLHRKVISRGH